jgi:hypothetical protein
MEQLEKKYRAIAQENIPSDFAKSILKQSKRRPMTRARKPHVVKKAIHSCQREIARDESPERDVPSTDGDEILTKKGKSLHHGCVNNNEIETPDNVLLELQAEFGQMFDPCPFVGKGKNPDFDGRVIPWRSQNFVNPPYNDISPWMEKAILEMNANDRSSLLFVPVRTGTRYWEKLVYPDATEIRFVTGRVMFKGYKTPSPFHLGLIAYKGETERTAERLNNEWLITDTIAADYELQELFPLLFRVTQAAHPTTSSYTAQLNSTDWTIPLWSLSSLMEDFNTDTLPMSIKSQILPLFLDMIEVYTWNSTLEFFDIDVNARHPLPELLRRSTHQFATSEEIRGILRSNPVEPTEEEFDMLVAFYEAFSTNALIRRLNSTKQFHVKTSTDGKFLQEVFILR